MLEHFALGGADIAVIRIHGHAEPFQRAGHQASDLEPAPVHAVTRAVDVASWYALVRLHEIEAFAHPGGAGGASE